MQVASCELPTLVLGNSQVLLAKLSGISLLVTIALCPEQRPPLIAALYLLRTWCMNCPTALSKSVLNDYVPKRQASRAGCARKHTCTHPPIYPI